MFRMKLFIFLSEIIIGSVFCITNNESLVVGTSNIGNQQIEEINVKSRQSTRNNFFPTNENSYIDTNTIDQANGPIQPERNYNRGTFKFVEDSPYQNQVNPTFPNIRQQYYGNKFNTGEYIVGSKYTVSDHPVSQYQYYKPQSPQQYNLNQPSSVLPPTNNQYAQYYYNNQPNRRRKPTSSNPYLQGYYQQSYFPQQLTAAYPNQQIYAGNFNSYQSSGNPLSNFLTGIGQGAMGFLGVNNGQQQSNGLPPRGFNDFARAIDAITKNDDFQCIPKIICQMVGSQSQQNTISPIFSALIAAVPSTSAGLTYGRAALLGYTSGDSGCNSAYPKCPRNEEDLLYYLNNHRGGFFRFFNSGGAFGIDNNYQYNPNPQNYNPNQQNQQPHSGLENLVFLQGLANAINQGGGINLSNPSANAGLLNGLTAALGGQQSSSTGSLSSTTAQGSSSSDSSTGGVGDIFSNLLTGFVGNRFSSRKISKRSIESENNEKAIIYKEEREENEKDEIKNEEDELNIEDSVVESQEANDEIEGRIINYKQKFNKNGQLVAFPNSIEKGNKINFFNSDDVKDQFIFKNTDNFDKGLLKFPEFTFKDSYRKGKKVNFDNNLPKKVESFFPDQFTVSLPIEDDRRLKMIFPDRTGTGDLKFDTKDFEENRSTSTGIRFGRILTGIRRPSNPSERPDYQIANVYQGNGVRYQNPDNNNNRYPVQTLQNLGNYQRPTEDVSQNVYVTNAHGVTEYYIKNGQKFYLKK